MIRDWLKRVEYLVLRKGSRPPADKGEGDEFCPRCHATLGLQKGYDPNLRYWICKGCGEMLINPEIESDIVWFCDECGAVMSAQKGFTEAAGEWKCAECGYVNKIDPGQIYLSEDEFQAERRSPYRGLSDEAMLELSEYREVRPIDGRDGIILVESRENGARYIKKLLTTYNKSVYAYLCENPIGHMPRIVRLFESKNCLIVIEEFIEGITVEKMLEEGPVPEMRAVAIAIDICKILDQLHSLSTPIIHRDIKPANIIVSTQGEVYLLDMNVAKWFDPAQVDDTRYMGTQYFAAPEQVGYGFSASSAKSDIYAVGMLLNVMLTGHFPKEEKASGKIWDVIERCIRLDADERYNAAELTAALQSLYSRNGECKAVRSEAEGVE